MTVQDNYKLETYITNGNITSFDFSFKVLEKEDIVVNVEDIQGNIIQKQQQTDYDVILNNDFTGTVIFNTAPAKDYKIYIQRIVDLEQEARYETSSGFQAEVVEKSFDKLTMISQQQQAEIDTCLKINQFKDVKISNAETPIESKGIMWAKNEDGSFYLKNTQENPDDVYNEIILNPDVIAIGSDLRTDNSIGICAENIEDINKTVENIEDINLCGNDIENINIVGNFLKEHENVNWIDNKVNLDGSNATFTNLQAPAKENIQNCLQVDLDNPITVSNGMTVEKNGILYFRTGTLGDCQIYINGVMVYRVNVSSGSTADGGFLMLFKGDVLTFSNLDLTTTKFYYFK